MMKKILMREHVVRLIMKMIYWMMMKSSTLAWSLKSHLTACLILAATWLTLVEDLSPGNVVVPGEENLVVESVEKR
jgi:hypothetical protein